MSVIDYLKKKYLVPILKKNIEIKLNLSPRKKLKRGKTDLVVKDLIWKYREHERIVYPPRPRRSPVIFFD